MKYKLDLPDRRLLFTSTVSYPGRLSMNTIHTGLLSEIRHMQVDTNAKPFHTAPNVVCILHASEGTGTARLSARLTPG